ncbi:hypothetical protein HY486_03990 [Candidatus Woesearchaeota archaeon]|nr:hypothetical protein [Candidatus Woesearchaeota archaeon]
MSNTLKIILVAGIILLGFFAVYYQLRPAKIIPQQPIVSAKTSEGEVTIDLIPAGYTNGVMAFNIEVNTHTIDLSQFDLSKLTTLEYEGKTILPKTASKLTGHHNSGIITFQTEKEIKNYKIIIKEFAGVPERAFEW